MPPKMWPAWTSSTARSSKRRMSRTVRYRATESGCGASDGAEPAPVEPGEATSGFAGPTGAEPGAAESGIAASDQRRLTLADGGQDPVPQLRARLQRPRHRDGALVPLGVVVPAQVGEHLHGHRRVLLAVDLDVPRQVVDE